ncbi:MAG: Uma2 family endonuclease [Blastocatellia bacterium]|nr:Uma2 family endonuclease [Blastocatellia bacterium]
MSVAVASEYLEAVTHLPTGAKLLAEDVTWEDYEQLLSELGSAYSVRVFYDRGRMEIVSPKPIHERPIEILHRLVTAISDQLEIDIESLGSTTLKRQMREAGAEPDASFYMQNAAVMHGYLDLDLAHDPPPDLVIESDHTSSSLDKFEIYARLGVPEIWRVFSQQVSFWRLSNNRYIEADHSHSFPFLTSQTLNEYLEQGLMSGERRAAKAFRDWIKTQTEQA